MTTRKGGFDATQPGLANGGWLDLVCRQVGSLRFGVVQIVVHESRVVQIERTEKLRLDNPAARAELPPARPLEA